MLPSLNSDSTHIQTWDQAMKSFYTGVSLSGRGLWSITSTGSRYRAEHLLSIEFAIGPFLALDVIFITAQ